MRGSDVYYPLVLGLGEAARELLAENGVEFALAGSDLVAHETAAWRRLAGS